MGFQPKRPESKQRPRRPLDFAIEELEWRRDMLKEMGPASDSPTNAAWKVRALEKAIERLRMPYFEVNPFV